MLGDTAIICTAAMCGAGDASINQMDAIFLSLPANLQASFQSAHDTLMSSYNTLANSYWDYVPFNTHCCTQQQMGQQADVLTCQMQTANGQSCLPAGPGSQSSGISITTMIVLGAVGYLALVYFAGRH